MSSALLLDGSELHVCVCVFSAHTHPFIDHNISGWDLSVCLNLVCVRVYTNRDGAMRVRGHDQDRRKTRTRSYTRAHAPRTRGEEQTHTNNTTCTQIHLETIQAV